MSEVHLETLKFPIGKFEKPDLITDDHIQQWITSIEELPARLNTIVTGLNIEDFQRTYRPGGWNIQQLVHHIADSHINAYTRFKLTLTEERPTIKPYDEKGWSLLTDVNVLDAKVSLDLIKALHRRWVVLLKNLSSSDLERTYYHPEDKVEVNLAECIGMYARHGEHHLAHMHLALK